MNKLNTLSLALTATLATTTITAQADTNPFSMETMSGGYMQLAGAHSKAGDGKCGEAKCGGNSTPPPEKVQQASCGSSKKNDASCGATTPKVKDASCGATPKATEAKCGNG